MIIAKIERRNLVGDDLAAALLADLRALAEEKGQTALFRRHPNGIRERQRSFRSHQRLGTFSDPGALRLMERAG